MRTVTNTIGVIGVFSLFTMLTVSGCAQKTVKLDSAEETAVVADTAGAKSSASTKANTTDPVVSSKSDLPPANEASGTAESLDTQVSAQDDSSAMSGATAVVPGSRTDLGLLPIYFDYDKSLVRPDQVERMAANARLLKDNSALKVRIEGNCDERGTNEYNLALGERRAMGAKKYLVNLGIADGRVSVLSYGEERPVNLGHDETSWAANRRGDFVKVQ